MDATNFTYGTKGKEMFNKKCKKSKYQKHTIQSLIYSLKEIMTENPELTWDSEVIISDLKSMEFRKRYDMYVTTDYKDGKTKLCLFTIPDDTSEYEDEPETKTKTKSNWWNKY